MSTFASAFALRWVDYHIDYWKIPRNEKKRREWLSECERFMGGILGEVEAALASGSVESAQRILDGHWGMGAYDQHLAGLFAGYIEDDPDEMQVNDQRYAKLCIDIERQWGVVLNALNRRYRVTLAYRPNG